MRITVTGGAGFLGSILVPRLLSGGHSVHVLDDMSGGGSGLLAVCGHPRLKITRGSVTSPRDVDVAVQGSDLVIHLAALVGYLAGEADAERTQAVNVGGTECVLAAREPSQRLIFASTGSVYGAVESGTCTEDTPKRPRTTYSQSKSVAEDAVLATQNTVALRFATAFGSSPKPRMDLLVNRLVHDAWSTGRIVLFEPDAQRTLVHVRDMALAITEVERRWEDAVGKAINIGGEHLNLRKREIAAAICDHLPARVEIDEGSADPDRRDYPVSYQVARGLGMVPRRTLDEGVTELLAALTLIGDHPSRSATLATTRAQPSRLSP